MRAMLRATLLVMLCGVSLVAASAQAPICPARPLQGTPVNNPVDLFSANGVLTVNFAMQNAPDIQGFMHYCYAYIYQGTQIEAPTLRVNPGDTLVVNLTNNITEPTLPGKKQTMHMHMQQVPGAPADDCSGNPVLDTSTNMHFHGLNVPPTCHQDDVIDTVINPGPNGTFQYSIQIPANEPPGMYWYHPHIHGITTHQVNGGASGAIIVEGNNPLVQGLNERILILREQTKISNANDPDANTQMTLNFQPAIYPEGGLAPTITMQAGAREYWRFLNASSKQFMSLQLTYNGVAQQFEVLSIDGVQVPTPLFSTLLKIPPAGRMEFIVPGLPAGQTGIFSTLGYDTGAVGDINGPQRLASLSTGGDGAQQHLHQLQEAQHPAKAPTQPVRFSNLANLTPNVTRQLYFSEQNTSTNGNTQFYLTVAGQAPRLFHMDDPPAIVTNTGSVEDWTLSNRSGEVHAFHIHQIHFLVEAINGVPVTNPEMQDTVIIPNWTGTGPYPSVTVRMDFRDPNIAGTFVYHCHILDHEDGGMMAKIQVNPAN
jgi:FtsP/CotA-like multicopper oxidase with cupredoxin domain